MGMAMYNRDGMIEINAEFMEKSRKVIGAFLWDNIEYANKSFEYFKNTIENFIKENDEAKIGMCDFAEVFQKTCDFYRIHYKESENTPFLLKKYLNRLGVGLKDAEYKDFESSGELDGDLWGIRSILRRYKIDLWCMFDDEFSQLVIARLEDRDLIDNWCYEVGMDFLNRV